MFTVILLKKENEKPGFHLLKNTSKEACQAWHTVQCMGVLFVWFWVVQDNKS